MQLLPSLNLLSRNGNFLSPPSYQAAQCLHSSARALLLGGNILPSPHALHNSYSSCTLSASPEKPSGLLGWTNCNFLRCTYLLCWFPDKGEQDHILFSSVFRASGQCPGTACVAVKAAGRRGPTFNRSAAYQVGVGEVQGGVQAEVGLHDAPHLLCHIVVQVGALQRDFPFLSQLPRRQTRGQLPRMPLCGPTETPEGLGPIFNPPPKVQSVPLQTHLPYYY